MVEVSDVEKLMRGVLQAVRMIETFRTMRPDADHDWLSAYAEARDRIDTKLEPHLFAPVAQAFGTLLLMHHNSDHDWLRKCGRGALRKRKKRRGKKASNDDDNDDDDDEEEDEEQEMGVSDKERDDIDRAIETTATTTQVVMNLDSASCVPLEKVFESYRTFVPSLEPLLFEASRATKRRHDGIDYGLLMLVHTAAAVADTTAMLEKCARRLRVVRARAYERLGYASEHECKCRILLVGWGESYETRKSRGQRAIKKHLALLNRTNGDGVSCEFFSIDELQHDVTKGDTEQFVALQEDNITPQERRWLRTVKTYEMRRLNVNEPQASVRGFVVGQRIRVRRSHVHLGGESVEYLQVVQPSNE